MWSMTLPLEEEVDICMPLYLPREPDKAEAYDLLGTRIYLAEPTKVLAEDFATVLDVGETRKARRVELDSMNHFELGKIIPESEVFSITKTHGIKPISCRWVLGPKDIKDSQGRMYQGVRARAVVQEIARGKTAQELGISSATPSCESCWKLTITVNSRTSILVPIEPRLGSWLGMVRLGLTYFGL